MIIFYYILANSSFISPQITMRWCTSKPLHFVLAISSSSSSYSPTSMVILLFSSFSLGHLLLFSFTSSQSHIMLLLSSIPMLLLLILLMFLVLLLLLLLTFQNIKHCWLVIYTWGRRDWIRTVQCCRNGRLVTPKSWNSFVFYPLWILWQSSCDSIRDSSSIVYPSIVAKKTHILTNKPTLSYLFKIHSNK